jgi:hypothetical protein
MVALIGSKPDPTAQVLSQWRQGSVGLLRSILGQLDRWDIVNDTQNVMGEKLPSMYIDSSSYIFSLRTKVFNMNQYRYIAGNVFPCHININSRAMVAS